MQIWARRKSGDHMVRQLNLMHAPLKARGPAFGLQEAHRHTLQMEFGPFSPNCGSVLEPRKQERRDLGPATVKQDVGGGA